MRSIDRVSIKILLCGSASTLSCRSAILASSYLSVHLAVCNNSKIDFGEILNPDETYRHTPCLAKMKQQLRRPYINNKELFSFGTTANLKP
jgi:hypothetical protein